MPKKQKKSKNGDQKIRVAEIHLSRIAKLDRAEKRDSDVVRESGSSRIAGRSIISGQVLSSENLSLDHDHTAGQQLRSLTLAE